jgi:hypothetical protein
MAEDKPNINPAYIAQYVGLRERRRQLDTMSRNLGKLMGVMEYEMLAKIEQETHAKDPVRKLNIGGWEIAIGEKPKSVSWATEFVKHCGAAIALKVKQAAGNKKIFVLKALTRPATRVVEDAQYEAEQLYKPAA